MEELLTQLVSLLLIAIVSLPFLWAYKHRRILKNWINDPEYGLAWEANRKKQAERAIIKAEWKLKDVVADPKKDERQIKKAEWNLEDARDFLDYYISTKASETKEE